jgi:hypothetical protein
MQPRDLIEDLGSVLGLVIGSSELNAGDRADLLLRAFERARGTMEILSIMASMIDPGGSAAASGQPDAMGRDAVNDAVKG